MKKKIAEKVIGFKGFDKDFKCRNFQYEVGKEYVHESEIGLCESGFHFCENPLDVLSYYPLIGSKFAEIEVLGKVVKETNGDKSVTNHLKIGAEIDLSAFIKASVNFIWERASEKGIFKKGNATSGSRAHSATSGNDAHSATSGEYAHSATSGSRANSATSGYGAHSATSGNDAIACSVGRKASAKASIGCWIVVAEWEEGKEFTDAKPICVLSAKVDGEIIKADVFYKVEGGKFVVEEN